MVRNQKTVHVVGHRGMVGSAICREFASDWQVKFVECDYRAESSALKAYCQTSPDLVVVAAGRVGGIGANQANQYRFLSDNMQIAMSSITAAEKCGVERLIYISSSCAYGVSNCDLRENDFGKGKLEPTNEGYALAKIAGVKLCQFISEQYGLDYQSVIPTNLYGCNDCYSEKSGHVVGSLLKRFHDAAVSGQDFVVVWGTGEPIRDLLFVDDLAKAVRLVAEVGSEEVYNVGSGIGLTIQQIAVLIAKTVGFSGKIVFDTSKPNGAMRKVLNISRISELGWKKETTIFEGLEKAYQSMLGEVAV